MRASVPLTPLVFDRMRELAQSGTTTIIATHAIGCVCDLTHRVTFLEGGRIREIGMPTRCWMHPREQATRSFLARVSAAGCQEEPRHATG